MTKPKKPNIFKQMPKKNDPQLKPHYKGLTFKEGRFVDELAKQAVEDGEINRAKAARKTYNAKPKTAIMMGSRLMSKDKIRTAYLAELDRNGLNDEVSIQTFKRQFTATKPSLLPDGSIEKIPDNAIQLRAVQEYHKLKGYYAPTTSQSAKLNVYAELTPQDLEAEERAIAERVKSLEATTEDEKG